MTTNKAKHPRPSSLHYQLLEIKLIDYFIEVPSTFDPLVKTGLKYTFQTTIEVDTENSSIEIIIFYKFFSWELELFNIRVKNVFKVSSLPQVNAKNKTAIDDFIFLLTTLSINHSRGIQATIIRNTLLSTFYIPIMPRDIIMTNLKAVINEDLKLTKD